MKDATTLEKLTETILGSRQLAAKQLGTPPQFAVGFKFANGARAGAALSADGDAPEEVIREMMVTLALALRPVAFALSMESWAVMERGT